jgi:hypothetical protein
MRYWKSDNAVKLRQFCAGIVARVFQSFEGISDADQ